MEKKKDGTMSKQEILDLVENNTHTVVMRDAVCARSALYGLRSYFDYIPAELVTAGLALVGGCGVGNGSCGAYVGGLLAIGMKYNPTLEEEAANPDKIEELRGRGFEKFLQYRDAFLKEYGSTLCPDICELIYGRRFNLLDEKENAEFLSQPDLMEKGSVVIKKAARLAAEILLQDEV